jgi:iduronate 2-sulfatase
MRKTFYLLFLILISCTQAAQNVDTRQSKRPNILMICIDDLNTWLGCMDGHPNVKTPNIDKLAARGTLFMNAHCQAPLCGPSRASIMTGLRPSSTGIYGQIRDDDIRKDNPVTKDIIFLPEYMKKQGYKTIGKGKIFHRYAPKGVFEVSGGRPSIGMGPKPKKRFAWPTPEVQKKVFNKGFITQTDWAPYPASDDLLADTETAEWTVEQLKKDHDRPFFMVAGFIRPHVPWYVSQKWFDKHPLKDMKIPPYLKGDQNDVPLISRQLHEMTQMPTAEWAKESGEWKKIIQAYLACVTYVDDCAGQVLEALAKSKYADNTIVILWSDHGYHLGEKNRFTKHSLWKESSNVPLIIALPGGKKQVCHKAVELLDLYPTILDLCNMPAYKRNEGRSITQLVDKPKTAWPHVAITTYLQNNHAVRNETHSYIHYEDGSEELYDLKKDPNEWHNIAGQKQTRSAAGIPRAPVAVDRGASAHWQCHTARVGRGPGRRLSRSETPVRRGRHTPRGVRSLIE